MSRHSLQIKGDYLLLSQAEIQLPKLISRNFEKVLVTIAAVSIEHTDCTELLVDFLSLDLYYLLVLLLGNTHMTARAGELSSLSVPVQPCTCASVLHTDIPYLHGTTGAVHSKYTEEKSASASQKIIVSEVLVLGYLNGASRKYETNTVTFCGYRL